MVYENVEIVSEPVDGIVEFKILDGKRSGEVWKIKTKEIEKIKKWEAEGSY